LIVGAKLYERGASAGQVITFLLSSPWNSFSLTLVLIGLIGWFWTFSFIFLSMLIAIITGLIFDVLVSKKVLPPNHNTIQQTKNFHFWKEAKYSFRSTNFNFIFFKEVFLIGIKESRMVLRWLLFGISLAALLRVIFNPDTFQNYFGPTVIGLFISVFVATVMEVCSEGTTPIAADILNRASAPGNGFAFLMAGVATDYTEIMVLKDTTKSLKLALFMPLITIPQVISIAWIVNNI
jgi:uncharacterized membrane protein YraQ (UPF0718 family)